MTINPIYGWIAAHIEVDKMHKIIRPEFSAAVRPPLKHHPYTKFRAGPGKRLLSKSFLDAVEKHHKVLDSAIIHKRDYNLTYANVKDMQNRFLGRRAGVVVERIQHMYMRVAVAMHLDDLPNVLATYELLSSGYAVHDSFLPLYLGTTERFLSSSFSMSLTNCDVQDVFDAVAKTVFAVRRGARVGIAAHAIPCNGKQVISSRTSHLDIGLWPLMKLLEGALAFARRADDRRSDTVNLCIPAWHIDARSALEFNNLHQHELSDQRGITMSFSLPDILYHGRVDDDAQWTLFCPRDVPDLLHLTGRDFDLAYACYESSSVPCVKIRAKDLWGMILRSLIVTGGPSILFADTINGKSNLTDTDPSCHADLRTGMIDHLGDEDELYPRNKASIALHLFVTHDGLLDYPKLHQVTKATVFNLNRMVDKTLPHLSALLDTNKEYRAIAIGFHGLSDVFSSMRVPYDSLEAADISVRIAETMYHAALEASCELAEIDGPYDAYYRSPMSDGILQYDEP
ncbi:ribonucleotide reductase [Mycena crocata]|nr:ribonucleotide reductase [Mycena crocata]